MRIFIPAIFTTLLTTQALMAQNCSTLCDYNFWRTATVENVQTAINAGEDINAVNEFGYPVFESIMSQSVAEFLMSNPQGDAEGEQKRRDSLILFMLESGVDLATNETVGKPYLHLAARNGSVAVIARMIEAGSPVDELDGGQNTALHYAAAGGNVAMIEYLMNAGLDIDAVNEDGETPLYVATGFNVPNAPATVIWLIENGADVNMQDTGFRRTPVMNFFFWGGDKRIEDSSTVLRAAVAAGYDITLSTSNGDNMLHYATWVGRNPKVIEYLIELGADITVQNNDGKTAYDLAQDNIFIVDAEIIKALQ